MAAINGGMLDKINQKLKKKRDKKKWKLDNGGRDDCNYWRRWWWWKVAWKRLLMIIVFGYFNLRTSFTRKKGKKRDTKSIIAERVRFL